MRRLILSTLAMLTPLCASGECGPDNAEIRLGLPPEAFTIRHDLLSQLCSDARGTLVDITDKTLADRFTPPSQLVLSPMDSNPASLIGHLVMMFVIDTDGSTSHPTVLISSGDKKLDEQTVKGWSTFLKFKKPGVLDGHPVRVLSYFKFQTKVNGVRG